MIKVGMRLLEVNGTNVIGVTRQEAIEAFRRAGHVLRLLVCDGWNNKEPPLPSSTRNSTAGSIVGEDTHSVTSNFTNSLERTRRPSSRQVIHTLLNWIMIIERSAMPAQLSKPFCIHLIIIIYSNVANSILGKC